MKIIQPIYLFPLILISLVLGIAGGWIRLGYMEFTVNGETEVTQLNPGISAGLKRNLGENFSLGFWLARVSRSGSISERYINYFPIGVDPYEMFGNPDLNPETNNQVDLVFGYNRSRISFELNLFASYLTDYITAEKAELTQGFQPVHG